MRSAHPYGQSLLVQAAWRVCRFTDPRAAALRARAQAIAARRGKKIVTVALARRLARLLYAMWRDEVDYQPAAATGSQRDDRHDKSNRRVAIDREVVKLEE